MRGSAGKGIDDVEVDKDSSHTQCSQNSGHTYKFGTTARAPQPGTTSAPEIPAAVMRAAATVQTDWAAIPRAINCTRLPLEAW